MSSLFDDIQTEIGSPLALELQGESIMHWPLGVSGNAVPVVAIVVWDDTEKVTKNGKEFCTKGRLRVSSGNTLHDDDVWVINSIEYQAVSVSPPRGGLVKVEIQYTEKRYTNLKDRLNK